ncbi:hypothetical protein HQ520_11325 [bacterium]|nr:hypothetical protein [bacterium]
MEKIEGDDVFIRQDLRDTAGWWFYWCFRVRNAQGTNLTFHYADSKNWKSVFGARGPAICRDRGMTWTWLGREKATEDSFSYSFGPEEKDVRFSFAMPYQEADLRRFLDRHDGSPYLRDEVLCESRKGRRVERLHLGCLDREPEYRLLFTCRHHACEMMASYVLEGLMEEVLSNSEAGQYFHRSVEILIVPMLDKDGVEDGDQGKSRKPWDHVLDYREEPIYPETAAVMDFLPRWSQGKLVMAADVHCPSIRGKIHEVLMSPDRLRGPENWARAEEFFAVLESIQQGPLKFRLADSQEFTTWTGPEGHKGPTPRLFTTWVRTVPGILFGTAFEIPYANAGGGEVNQMTARAFGHDLARALPVYLETKARRGAATERQAVETAE